jgi:pimeloyl-ACP methyl ester carboxylesterase
MEEIFFTSYARPDNSDTKLEGAIRQLEKRVRAKIGLAADAKIAFFDVEDIKTGQDWEKRLDGVLRGTKIIVCMCSPTYVNSPFCAKEFEVFRRRLARASAAANVFILPVIWEPGQLPAPILKYQFTDARLPDAYGKTLGLSHFTRLASQTDKLDDAIEVLADVIDQAEQNGTLEAWADPIVFDELPSFLHNPKREPYKNVTLTVLNTDQAQWKMGTLRRSIGAIADATARDLQISLEILDPNLVTLANSLEQARASRHMSIVAVDFDDAGKAPWRQILDGLDAAARSNCAVLVGWKRADLVSPADMQAKLRTLLPKSSASVASHAHFPLSDDGGVRAALTTAITELQMALIAEDKHLAQTVESAELRYDAGVKGIDVDSRPTVSNTQGTGA